VAERTSPIFALAGGATLLAAAASVGWLVWDQSRPVLTAPTEAKVCWRMHDRRRFEALGRNVENLESCAANLETLHLDHGGTVEGAYQGRFIFIDSSAIRSASSIDGGRWRIFYGPQREALDKRIRTAQQRAAKGLPTLPIHQGLLAGAQAEER
jgi:hypothetical protein